MILVKQTMMPAALLADAVPGRRLDRIGKHDYFAPDFDDRIKNRRNMLTIYTADWCPHCKQTIDFLKKHRIEFNPVDIEKQPDHIVKKVIEVNGGDDWVIPTLEYKGRWREGKIFDETGLTRDLQLLGVDIPSR